MIKFEQSSAPLQIAAAIIMPSLAHGRLHREVRDRPGDPCTRRLIQVERDDDSESTVLSIYMALAKATEAVGFVGNGDRNPAPRSSSLATFIMDWLARQRQGTGFCNGEKYDYSRET